MEEKIIASGSSALVQSEAEFDASFIQTRSQRKSDVAPPEAPETFGAYEKKGEKSGGVMALMDMIINELKSSLQEAKFTEKQAQKDYVELMKDSQDKRAQDGKSITTQASEKAELESALTEAKENQALTMDELENVM